MTGFSGYLVRSHTGYLMWKVQWKTQWSKVQISQLNSCTLFKELTKSPAWLALWKITITARITISIIILEIRRSKETILVLKISFIRPAVDLYGRNFTKKYKVSNVQALIDKVKLRFQIIFLIQIESLEKSWYFMNWFTFDWFSGQNYDIVCVNFRKGPEKWDLLCVKSGIWQRPHRFWDIIFFARGVSWNWRTVHFVESGGDFQGKHSEAIFLFQGRIIESIKSKSQGNPFPAKYPDIFQCPTHHFLQELHDFQF